MRDYALKHVLKFWASQPAGRHRRTILSALDSLVYGIFNYAVQYRTSVMNGGARRARMGDCKVQCGEDHSLATRGELAELSKQVTKLLSVFQLLNLNLDTTRATGGT